MFDDFFRPTGQPTVYIFHGLQASGKSTFYRMYLSDKNLVSKDLLRNNAKPQRRQMRLIEESLKQNQDVVVDNTNASKKDREPIIALAKEYSARIVCVQFVFNKEECIERNNKRQGKAKVPPVAIFSTLKEMQTPEPDEGFDAICRVALESNKFILSGSTCRVNPPLRP